MDISATLNKKKSSSFRRPLAIGSAIALILIAILGLASHDGIPQIELAQVKVATVQQGDLQVLVNGYGKLRAKQQRFLTSQSQAMVESIEVYPGTKVSKDTVILSMSNPQLKQQVSSARLELARYSAQLNELKIAHKSELLEREAQIALLKNDLENGQLRLEAETQLISNGVVSALDFKRTQLNVKQLQQRLTIEETRLAQLKQIHIERQKNQRDLVSQFELNYQSLLAQYNQLNVIAGLDGVLQTLSVDIGQSVAAGTQLAMVGSDKKLVAELRVQQREADQISLGMNAMINTFGDEVNATVSRIDPVVTEGRVIVELDLIGELPTNARPDLNVEGKIEVKTIRNTLFIERPAESYGFSQKKVFEITAENRAQLTAIEFGSLSGNQIQILNGASRDARIIVSDMTNWLDQKTLALEE